MTTVSVGLTTLFIREQSVTIASGQTIEPDSPFGKVVVALAEELQECRSKAHKCIQCGSGVGVFGERRVCPTCSND